MVDMLLRHPVPYINESIGNYVKRLCSENWCKLDQLTRLIGIYHFIGIEKYYRKLKEENIIKFSELTGIDIKVIENMTANRFCFDKNNDFSYRNEACVCPKCYSESSYERIQWKNKLIKVCLDHMIYLVDECPRCKERITSDILFNGQCVCGLLIKDFKYGKCDNEHIIQNQNILYQIFNIKSRAPLYQYDLLYNSLSAEDYCEFLCYLQKLAARYIEDLNDIWTFYDNDEGYKCNIIASWIMLDWPVNLINILNILNDLDIKYITRSSYEVDNRSPYSYIIQDRFIRIFNPLACLKLSYREDDIVCRYEEIYQPLMNYYYEKINKENVKIKMDRYIYLNNYVEWDIAIKIFFKMEFSIHYLESFVKKYFRVYKYFNKEYLSLEEIFDFFSIKNSCSASISDIKDITYEYSRFLYYLQKFNFDLDDIIYVSKRLKVRFDPIRRNVIYIQFDQTKKNSLWTLLRRILKDKD